MLPRIIIFLTLALLPTQHAHSPGRSFRGRAFQSGGPNYWHYRGGFTSWPRRKGGSSFGGSTRSNSFGSSNSFGGSSTTFGGTSSLRPYPFQPQGPNSIAKMLG